MASVYILQSERNGRYYTGYALNVPSRPVAHNEGRVRATRYLRPWLLVYVEAHENATSARKREYRIKSMKSRIYIEQLINDYKARALGKDGDREHASPRPEDD